MRRGLTIHSFPAADSKEGQGWLVCTPLEALDVRVRTNTLVHGHDRNLQYPRARNE